MGFYFLGYKYILGTLYVPHTRHHSHLKGLTKHIWRNFLEKVAQKESARQYIIGNYNYDSSWSDSFETICSEKERGMMRETERETERERQRERETVLFYAVWCGDTVTVMSPLAGGDSGPGQPTR